MLKSWQLGGLALDVYEPEADLFFRDLSSTIIADAALPCPVSFPNVIVTGHQSFVTHQAMTTICQTTLRSVTEFESSETLATSCRGDNPGGSLMARRPAPGKPDTE